MRLRTFERPLLSALVAIGLLGQGVVIACGTDATTSSPGNPATGDAPTMPTPTTTSTASAPEDSAPPPPAGPKSGKVLFATGAPIANLPFESGAQKGVTAADGTFTYEVGTPVRFTAGGILLGAPAGADVISPYQIVGSSKCEDTDDLTKLVSLLEALDGDHQVENGITLPTSLPNAGAKPLADVTPAEIAALAATESIAAPEVALRTFITAFDGEAWTQLKVDTFTIPEAALRGQGVATDGTSWFFSGNTGLDKTNDTYASTKKNALAIPLDLAIQGSNHIGDIDVHNGMIYAPIEDKNYKAPKVVLYDAASLTSGTVFDIPVNLQTKGVPWIAVDGPRGVAYMAEWDPTPAINVFALSTMTFVRAIPLSTVIGRVQGAKVMKGQLYLSTDDAEKHVFKMHLSSGTVFPVFALKEDVEMEGIAFFARPDGSLMHTLDVPSSRTLSELRHHRITREPLRWAVCP